MMIATEALYAINRTISPSNADFFFLIKNTYLFDLFLWIHEASLTHDLVCFSSVCGQN